MIPRNDYIKKLETAVGRSPVTALLGSRQCGKTTLAREFSKNRSSVYFDLESQPDLLRLQNPELVFQQLKGLIIIDEIQIKPELFSVLRVVVDKPECEIRFLILGSASPDIVKGVSESLAGRVEFIELSGFNLSEIESDSFQTLWLRGGFPRSFLAASDTDSSAWLEGFIKTFLERDIPQLGISIPSQALRRFWTMMAHYHGQIWNASKIARSMGVSDKTARSYLDILTGTFVIRQLQPWYENIGKRQVKAPKIYFRDTGLLHHLLNIPDIHSLFGNPQVGASWEGFALEQILQCIKPLQAYFWSTHGQAELDLMVIHKGKRFGFEMKFSEAPSVTTSMKTASKDLNLDHLYIVYPGNSSYPITNRITAVPAKELTLFKSDKWAI